MSIILPILLAQSQNIGSFTDKNCIGAFCPTGKDAGGTQIEAIFTQIFGFLTIAAGIAFLIYFVIGGITWISAGGDSSNIEKAKKMMTNAVIGMVVIASAFAITWIVGKVLGFDILDIKGLLEKISGGGAGPSTIPIPPGSTIINGH
jgi:cytochrome bd-type quinol oxidase subunit 2